MKRVSAVFLMAVLSLVVGCDGDDPVAAPVPGTSGVTAQQIQDCTTAATIDLLLFADYIDHLIEVIEGAGNVPVLVDGGFRRGTDVFKALAMGATACSGGRMYLYALAGAGPAGVDKAIGLLKAEIERDMVLMGCSAISELDPGKLARQST